MLLLPFSFLTFFLLSLSFLEQIHTKIGKLRYILNPLNVYDQYIGHLTGHVCIPNSAFYRQNHEKKINWTSQKKNRELLHNDTINDQCIELHTKSELHLSNTSFLKGGSMLNSKSILKFRNFFYLQLSFFSFLSFLSAHKLGKQNFWI